ncbi:MAG: ATP-binding cassette domain-containing protein, partial [Chlamydiae bacterium]|nr:ATP-binding cassette domain-containing protein [Chlamydiota bacterium]
MIELKNVAFGYGLKKVLHNVSFSIQDGEIVALIGVSGSGKTTLFRLMTGVEQPQEGSISGSDSVSY